MCALRFMIAHFYMVASTNLLFMLQGAREEKGRKMEKLLNINILMWWSEYVVRNFLKIFFIKIFLYFFLNLKVFNKNSLESISK